MLRTPVVVDEQARLLFLIVLAIVYPDNAGTYVGVAAGISGGLFAIIWALICAKKKFRRDPGSEKHKKQLDPGSERQKSARIN